MRNIVLHDSNHRPSGLARDDDLLRTAAAEELILLDAVVLADGINDEVDGK